MPRNPRRYDLEYEAYDGKPEVKKKRALRNAARREAERDGKVSKGDGMDVHHKKPLSKGGTNAKSNSSVMSASKNRSFPRTKTARMK
jgi:hypothetical protein